MSVRILIGDVRDRLRDLPDESVHCVVTSPPYFGLRDYGVSGQIGLEPTPDEFVAVMVDVFREVRRVLRPDGTLWLNLGDSYNSGAQYNGGKHVYQEREGDAWPGHRPKIAGLKTKDLVGIPWRVAFALQQPYYAGRIKNIQDRIWLAAMIDGEGCMFVHKRKAGTGNHSQYTKKDGSVSSYSRVNDTYGAGLEVANTSLAIVERCQKIAGIGSICKQENGRRQPIYRWNVRSNECRWVVEEVYPHLVGKQQQARVLLGCPSSGPKAEAAHAALIDLHNGKPTDVDFPPPASLFQPGYYLRQDIIWSKSNPMPESVRDRCTKAHEYLFLLTKSERYFYDAEAIKEPNAVNPNWNYGSERYREQIASEKTDTGAQYEKGKKEWHGFAKAGPDGDGRNKRSVWTITTQPFAEAHFATFPPELPELCIKAGCPQGGTVLDPFGGAGTTGLVADRLGRDAILIELNPEYAAIAERRIHSDAPLFADVMAQRLEAAE